MTTNYIPKLKGRENYEDWCFAMQNVLVLENMACAITTPLPVSPTASQTTEDAKAKLVSTIDPSLLLRKLINIRLENHDSMTQYVTQIVEMSQRLQVTSLQLVSNIGKHKVNPNHKIVPYAHMY
ncbi:hypothetical protein SFRURICE_006306 [Spodoptera frugiperda]|nr:hypothetical protein SFRURICE_006306 [Spodoptera frugiperda]